MSVTVTKSYTAVDQVSSTLPVAAGGIYAFAITGTFVGTLSREFSPDNGATWTPDATFTATSSSTNYTSKCKGLLRVKCTSYTSGSPSISLSTPTQTLLEVDDASGAARLKVTTDGISAPPIADPTGMAAYDPGQIAVNTLRVASNVVSAETVTIGPDIYEIDIVNTDSTDTCLAGAFNTTDPVTVLAATYSHLPTTLNSLIRIQNEMLRLIATGTYLTFVRGASGTTAATHANAQVIYKSDGVTAGRIPVGLVTTLTPTAFTAALLYDINNVGTSAVTAVLISVNEILLKANAVGAVVLATTETLAGANNAWGAAAMYGGKAQGVRKFSFQSRVPLALDVTLGTMKFQFDFTPTLVEVYVVVTATPGVALAWDGAYTIASGLLTIDNTGAADWAVTNTVYVYAQS